jgi:hypothetical protein
MTSQKLDEPEWILPFEAMRVGDSFFIPTLRPAEMTYVVDTRAKVAEVRIKSYPSIKDGCLGLRVWRIR